MGIPNKTSIVYVIKAIIPLFNYDGEPSVPKGISVPTSFVPPAHTPSASKAF